MGEDGEEDAIHADFVVEGAHGPGSSSDFAESPLDGIGGAHGSALVRVAVAEAGQQIVEVIAQAGDGCQIAFVNTAGEATEATGRRAEQAAMRRADGSLPLVRVPGDGGGQASASPAKVVDSLGPTLT